MQGEGQNGLLVMIICMSYFPSCSFWSVQALPNQNNLFITPRMCTNSTDFMFVCVPKGFDWLGITHDAVRSLPLRYCSSFTSQIFGMSF